MDSKSCKYSIIIPTLNEDKVIESSLHSLDKQIINFTKNTEIIIVDGSSNDNTVNISKRFNVHVINSEKGRGVQMNKGAELASGEILIFLHADSILPENALSIIDRIFEFNVNLTTFRMKFDKNHFLYGLYSYFTKFDSIFTTFGDQVVVVRKNFYDKIGGFKNQKIMEDVDFFRRARKITSIKKINSFVITSARKFDREGIIKTQIKNFILIIKYILGTSPDKIYQTYYNGKNKSSHSIRKISGIRQSKNKIGFVNK